MCRQRRRLRDPRRSNTPGLCLHNSILLCEGRRGSRRLGVPMKKDASPLALPAPDEKTLRRMWAKIKIPDGCWIWTGTLRDVGYPQSISVNESRRKGGNLYRPQRLMFHWLKYAIPPNFTVDHLCKNRTCVNPDHMEAVTHQENVSRAHKKPYCKRGHKQTPENRYTAPGSGRSRCKLCVRRKSQKS